MAHGVGAAASAAALLTRAKQTLIIRLFDYWLGKRQGRRMPARRDIDPLEIPWALAKIALVDYEPARDDFRFRLAGVDIADVFGRSNLKDVTLREIEITPSDVGQQTMDRWRPLVDGPAVLHVSGFIYLSIQRYPLGERLLLPLSDDDRSVAGAMVLDVRDAQTPPEGLPMEFADIQELPVDDLP